jgi:predicted TPR repeat methyltransferase
MRLLLLLLLLAQPALAQPTPRAPSPAQAELDRAFEALRAAPDEPGAHIVEQRIRQLLSARATPAIALLISRGQRNLASDLADAALEDFDAAITLAPEATEPWFGRALAHHATGDATAAARDLQQVLRLEPRHWQALQQLAQWQEEAGDDAGALRSIEAALAIHPRLRGGEARLRDLRRKALGDDA